jgi:hypothetical protein
LLYNAPQAHTHLSALSRPQHRKTNAENKNVVKQGSLGAAGD